MADWNAIKTEYITTDTSYRKLAKKHGVHYNAVANRAKQEGWVSQRNQYCDSAVTKAVEAVGAAQAQRAARLQSVADMLLGKVEALVEASDPLEMGTQAMKHISGVLKDIKEVHMIRPDADVREQEARIANLRKQAEEDSGDRSIEVIIAGDLKKYSN